MSQVAASELRVVIADDDAIVLAGVEALLSACEGITVVAACRSLGETLAAVQAHEPDVVLTDIRMPPDHLGEGVEIARRLRTTHPNVAVVVLSQYVDPQLALAVLEEGSRGRGYLLKEHVADAHYLTEVLQTVARGGSFIDNDVLDALVSARRGDKGSRLAELTGRELEVLAHMAEGHSNAGIGERLFVGERSVEKHISSIFAKLQLRNEPDVHRRVSAVIAYLAEHEESR